MGREFELTYFLLLKIGCVDMQGGLRIWFGVDNLLDSAANSFIIKDGYNNPNNFDEK